MKVYVFDIGLFSACSFILTYLICRYCLQQQYATALGKVRDYLYVTVMHFQISLKTV